MKKEDTQNNIISFETFKEIGNYEINNMKQNEPTCFNGHVSVSKCKITIEPVEESKEVYAERLQKLWDECDNHHHVHPISNLAKSYGIELKGSYGSKRPK